MSSWSEYQFQVANRFISQQVRRYGRHMDEIECMQEVWRAFLCPADLPESGGLLQLRSVCGVCRP